MHAIFRCTCPTKSYCSVIRITLKGRPRYKNSAAEKIAYALIQIQTSLTEFTRQPIGITSRANAYSYLYSENTKLQQRYEHYRLTSLLLQHALCRAVLHLLSL